MQLVSVGTIARAHGFKGGFVVRAPLGKASALESIPTIYVGNDEKGAVPFHVSRAAWMPKGWLLEVKNISSDDDVRKLIGRTVFADRTSLPATAGSYFVSDLVGAQIIDDASGEILGSLVAVEYGVSPRAHDWWVVQLVSEKISVPAVPRYIKSVDIALKTVRTENLLDLL